MVLCPVSQFPRRRGGAKGLQLLEHGRKLLLRDREEIHASAVAPDGRGLDDARLCAERHPKRFGAGRRGLRLLVRGVGFTE